MEDELEALKVARQVAEMQIHRGPASARHSAVMAEERPAGDIRQHQRLIAQEHSATQGATAAAAVAAPTGSVAPVETQPANRATTEVSPCHNSWNSHRLYSFVITIIWMPSQK